MQFFLKIQLFDLLIDLTLRFFVDSDSSIFRWFFHLLIPFFLEVLKNIFLILIINAFFIQILLKFFHKILLKIGRKIASCWQLSHNLFRILNINCHKIRNCKGSHNLVFLKVKCFLGFLKSHNL